jgi:hypothetical protein
MSKDIINFDVVRLTTELNKYHKHKSIPTSFFNGTWTIPHLLNIYDELDERHKGIADHLIEQYKVTVQSSSDGLYKSLLNEYRAFLTTQHTREDKWCFPPVMNKYRWNINPIRALTFDIREMAYSFNAKGSHHQWLSDLIIDPNFYNRVIQDIIKDRERVDVILNYYHPIYSSAGIEIPLELKHLQTLRTDLLEYAKLFTEFRNWSPDE